MPRRRYSEADLRAMIPLYLDGALEPSEREAVEAYWAEHPELLTQFAESTRLIDILDEAVTAPPAPDDLTARVMDRIRTVGRLGRWRETLSLNPPLDRIRWFAEEAMLVLVGWLLVTHPWAPSTEPIELQMHGSQTWTAARPVSLRLVARDRAGDKPLVSGDVSVRLQGSRWRQTIFRGRTNEQGTVDAALHLPDQLAAGRYQVIAEVAAPAGRAVVWHEVEVRAAPRVTITPLNPTVAAGSDLVARIEVRDAAGRLSSEPVSWQLTDRDGVRLAGGRDLVLPGGQGFVRAPIDASAPTGDATLWAGLGAVLTPAAVTLVPAVRQDLEVSLEPAAPVAVRGQPVRGAVRVSTALGAPVVGARVVAGLGLGPVRHERAVVTDAAGRAEFSLPAATGAEGLAALSATVGLADERGGVAARGLSVAAAPLTVRLDAAQGAVGGLPNRMYLRLEGYGAASWQGRADLSLNREMLPPLPIRAARTALRLTPRTGWNRLTVTLSREGTAQEPQSISFRAADPRQALRVEPLNTAVSAGGDVGLRVTAAQALDRVYLDLLQHGELVSTRSLSAADRAGRLVLRLPVELAGPVTLLAYAPAGERWLTGQAQLQIVPDEPAGLSLAAVPGSGEVQVQPPPGAALLVAATRPPRETIAVPEPPAAPEFRGYTLSSNSVPAAQRRALQAQQQFFAHSAALGGVMAMLILIALTAWAYQQFTDPLEWVSRAERRRFGRVPQVHRRGAWAGLGAVLAGVALATVVSGGLLLAGRQARELASQTGRAARFTGAPTLPAGRRAALLARAMVRQATPARLAPDLAAETICFGAETAPRLPSSRTASWQVAAFAAPAAGPTLSAALTAPRTGAPTVALQAPSELRIGEVVTVPVVVSNPTTERLPLAVTAMVNSGLELTVPPTQRVIVEPRAEVRLEVGLRAAEYGESVLVVEAAGQDLTTRSEAAIVVLPDAPRLQRLTSGWVDRDADLPVVFPAGASARRLQVECLQEPLDLWIDALHTAADRPAHDTFETIATADAEALALRLGRRSQRFSAARDAALLRRVQVALQRVSAGALRRPDGTVSGAFAAGPAGEPDLVATSFALLVLRRIDRYTPVDPLLLSRARGWLRTAASSAMRVPPDADVTEGRAGPSPAALAFAALALTNGEESDQAVVDAELDDLQGRVGLLPDTASLAWAAAAMVYERPRAAATAEVLRRLASLRNLRPDGSNWYPGAAPTPAGATGRGAAIEVTALAVTAFGQAEGYPEARDEGLTYLAAQQLDDGTWGDAYLTAQVVRAQMGADELPAAARGFVSASLEGVSLGRATFDGTGSDLLVKASPEPGEQVLRLRFFGRGRAAYRVRVAYTMSGPETEADGLVASLAAPTRRAARGDRLTFNLTVTNPGAVAVAGVLAELPVPAGFAVAGRPEAGSRLQLAVGLLPPGASRTVSFKLRAAAGAAQLAARPITVRALRDPGRSARVMLPPLRIS